MMYVVMYYFLPLSSHRPMRSPRHCMQCQKVYVSSINNSFYIFFIYLNYHSFIINIQKSTQFGFNKIFLSNQIMNIDSKIYENVR